MLEAPQRLYYTRRDAAEYIQKKFGIPVGRSRIAKDAMDGGAFPQPTKIFGKSFLYTAEQLDAYALTLIDEVTPAALVKPKRALHTKAQAGTGAQQAGTGAQQAGTSRPEGA
jgi:hypothetical protein